MLLLASLLALSGGIVANTHLPPALVEVRARHERLRQHLIGTGEFPDLHRRVLIKTFPPNGKEFGYNINKGAYIGLCARGDANDLFHVLIHELAHMTVEKYEHNDQFHANMDAIKRISVDIGVYEPIEKRRAYCGSHITD